MSKEENKFENKGQTIENKLKTSKLAITTLVCSLISVISLGLVYIIETNRPLWLPFQIFLLLTFLLSIGASFLLGFICLGALILCKNGFKRYLLGLFGIVISISIAGYIAIQTNNFLKRHICGLNIEGLGIAINCYSENYNGIFPEPNNWCDLLIENEDCTPKQFICFDSDAKFGESSYALNINLTGKKLDKLPSDTVVAFETDCGKESGSRNDMVESRRFSKYLNIKSEKGKQEVYKNRWNQCGGKEILTLNRHGGNGCNVLFVDGHVEWIKAEDINKLKWDVNDANE